MKIRKAKCTLCGKELNVETYARNIYCKNCIRKKELKEVIFEARKLPAKNTKKPSLDDYDRWAMFNKEGKK